MKYLKKDKKEIDRIVKGILLKKDEIEFAYFFGSYVNSETFHDIDIALYLDKNFNYKDPGSFPYGYETSVAASISRELKIGNIDIVILNRADLHLFKNVINTGKLIFEKNRFFRINCENNIIKEFIDTRHLNRIKNFYLTKKIEKNV
ncbi:MAG: nucleotidyltransferase domain-containing protein [Ignavibacteriaceae bacterium]|jgi:uncharacterized protein